MKRLLILIFAVIGWFVFDGTSQVCAQVSTGEVLEATAASQDLEARNTQQPVPQPPAGGGGGGGGGVATKEAASKRANAARTNGWLGSGNYLSITKIFLFIFVFWMWVLTVDWVSCDGEVQKIPTRFFWNILNFFPFTVLGTIFFYLPVDNPILFFVSYPLTIMTWLVPLFCYISVRNKPLPPYEKVMTYDHTKYLFAVALSKLGVKMKIEKKMSYQVGPPIEIEAAGVNLDNPTLNARTVLSRNHEGFNDLRRIVYEALERNADGIMFEFQAEQTLVKELIDGVWIETLPLMREKGPLLNTSIKYLIGGNPEEFRKRQAGSFVATVRKKTKFNADFVIQGTPTGEEKGIITFVIQKVPFDSLGELGMRTDMQEKVKSLINAPVGLVVFSAAPANGLRSTMNVVSRTADRFTRDFATVEDVQNPYQFVENVMLNQYNSRKGETPMTVLPDIFFREPHVLLIRDLISTDVFELCCNEIANERLIITTIRARDAADAMMRLLAMGIQPSLFASTITAVVAQRLIRRLCPDCKEVFEPQPALLQRLGLPPDRITELYRARGAPQPGEKRKPCLTCNDIGYRGRTAMYEIIEVNDEIRKILVANPTVDAIRKAATQSGQRGFLFEGSLLIAKGITSVEELARVMKM
ncbi:MAG: Flp pilus assembly complex ATPase component TadA [Planctomycetaceae bacterium]|nr:Flp pilus assembly complex ATPase component TadA [Planctomycetaceae bacterium]